MAVMVLSGQLVATKQWHESREVREYIKWAYPDIERALENGSYDQLGQTINAVYLERTSFSKAVLVGASWARSDRPQFNFSLADLSFANFAHADLSDCDLSNANLSGANLRAAILSCENIRGADFSNARVDEAIIKINGTEVPLRINSLRQCGAVVEDKLVYEFKTAKRTWNCHWFPMQETRSGGDGINNLFAVNGPLDKLDRITGGNARRYEYDNNRQALDAGSNFCWGHGDKAAMVASLLEEPKHSVVMKGLDGKNVRFTKNDIQGLLVKVVPSLSAQVDFVGHRYDGRENPSARAPELFLERIEKWAPDDLPFILNIDPGEQVLNFPYDQVKIYESDKAPQGFNADGLPSDGSVNYYHIEMAGSGYQSKGRIYECFVQKDAYGQVMKSGWVKTSKTHEPPAFMWRTHPVGNLMDKSVWVNRGKLGNPEVDPQIVYEIYIKSITEKPSCRVN